MSQLRMNVSGHVENRKRGNGPRDDGFNVKCCKQITLAESNHKQIMAQIKRASSIVWMYLNHPLSRRAQLSSLPNSNLAIQYVNNLTATQIFLQAM